MGGGGSVGEKVLVRSQENGVAHGCCANPPRGGSDKSHLGSKEEGMAATKTQNSTPKCDLVQSTKSTRVVENKQKWEQARST